MPNTDLVLRPRDEVITFVNRQLEPYRGYHVFMRALPEILKRRPEAQVLIVGGNGVSYGRKPPEGKSWRTIFLDEVRDRIDMSRVHFLGQIPKPDFLSMLQVSSCHVYLTYPFVLSWSMLEAMANECLVIGSATPPVQEVIEDGRNGLLVDFHSPEQVATAVVRALARPEAYLPLREAARRSILDRYDLHSRCLPDLIRLIDTVAAGQRPANFDTVVE